MFVLKTNYFVLFIFIFFISSGAFATVLVSTCPEPKKINLDSATPEILVELYVSCTDRYIDAYQKQLSPKMTQNFAPLKEFLRKDLLGRANFLAPPILGYLKELLQKSSFIPDQSILTRLSEYKADTPPRPLEDFFSKRPSGVDKRTFDKTKSSAECLQFPNKVESCQPAKCLMDRIIANKPQRSTYEILKKEGPFCKIQIGYSKQGEPSVYAELLECSFDQSYLSPIKSQLKISLSGDPFTVITTDCQKDHAHNRFQFYNMCMQIMNDAFVPNVLKIAQLLGRCKTVLPAK